MNTITKYKPFIAKKIKHASYDCSTLCLYFRGIGLAALLAEHALLGVFLGLRWATALGAVPLLLGALFALLKHMKQRPKIAENTSLIPKEAESTQQVKGDALQSLVPEGHENDRTSSDTSTS